MKKIKIKLNCDLKHYKKGDVISINPHDIYWRNRLRDAKQDNCIEIIHEKPQEKKTIKILKKEKKMINKNTIHLDRDFDKNH